MNVSDVYTREKIDKNERSSYFDVMTTWWRVVIDLRIFGWQVKKCVADKMKWKYTGCFFGIGALVFEKVLISETRGPILRNRGPIQRNTVSLNRTAHEWAVLFSETVFRWIGPRIFIEKTRVFEHVEQHLNWIFGSLFIATFLLAMNGPRSVITCSRGSPEVSTGSYPF